MIEFGVNLKRFDVPARAGGICPEEDPVVWIEKLLNACVSLGLGEADDVRVRLFLPESLLLSSVRGLDAFPPAKRRHLAVGSQTVFRENIRKDGNFGAFTANLPATAVRNMRVSTTLLGHSEERADKFSQLTAYDPEILEDSTLYATAARSVNRLVGLELRQAVATGLSVMLCVGETAEEQGPGTWSEQEVRVNAVLRAQLEDAFDPVIESMRTTEEIQDVVIAYEPRWAIGPGKTPPGAEYIGAVSSMIKDICTEIVGRALPVVYGGGLKRGNSAEVASVPTIDGGLVALTKFTPPIGFDPTEFRAIVDLFMQQKQRSNR
jgi:triosephosphate isomerase (TIM)